MRRLWPVFIVIALIVVACGGQPAPQPAAPPAASTSAPAAKPASPTEPPKAAPTEAPKAVAPAPTTAPAAPAPTQAAAKTTGGKKIVVGQAEIPTSLDPPTDWAIQATWVHMNLFDCLVWRNRDTNEWAPYLATSWQNINETTWRFKLREGVEFHNGEKFNADAVIWTYQRILDDPKMITYAQWTFIKEMKKISDYEVEFVTKTPEPAFLSKMAGTGCGIQAPIHGKQVGADVSTKPVGAGPYKLVSYTKGDRVILQANEKYWAGKPDIDTVEIRAIPEAATRVAALLSGQIDLTPAVPSQDWKRVQDNANLKLEKALTTQVMILFLRAGPSSKYTDWKGVTSNAKIRQAISLAIDRKALVDLVDGMGVPTTSRITPPTLGSDPKFYNQVGTYDPAKARALIKEAGYDGTPLRMHTANYLLKQSEVAQALQAMLQDVGLKVDMNIMDLTTFREKIYVPYKNEELYLETLGNSFFDPWIAVLSEQSDRRERSGWSGPQADEADKLIRAAAANMNPEDRKKQYIRIQELFNEDPVMVPLYQQYDMFGISKKLQWKPPLDGFLWFGNAKLTQ
ncbi:MAG: hypothetical protein KIT87_05350 [Anaerolineae bacterium]|nr:hypothetical protein [Anaerolineae bacterium]